ncbi:MAG: plasmid pRiA4b ORF-3 family protein [Candidatus Kapabacteria bacterium]|nr:plasmid pRiA4b ORF-3 family protein [Candidatus Kapabacteria bacterium]
MPKIPMITLKITLDGTKPAVWRTIIVREDMPLT